MDAIRCRVGWWALLLPLLGGVAAAESEQACERMPRVRAEDRRLGKALAQGLLVSPTLRAVVERIEASDLVVYLRVDCCAPSHVAGRLTFVSAQNGVRYIVVRIAPAASPTQLLAILGHELQHAVEIADAPAVVDEASLLAEYRRIGEVRDEPAGLVADTAAARAVEGRVRAEARSRAPDGRVAAR